MLPITPKELSGKIKYWENEVYVKDGIELTPDEQRVFDEYKSWFKQAQRTRFE